MSNLDTCFATQNATCGFFVGSGGSQVNFGSGPETAITVGNSTNSNSNGSTLTRCRDFALTGARASFWVEACEVWVEACEVELISPIMEGGYTSNCFEYDNLGSSVSKGVTITEPHIEANPTNAIYKIHTSTGNIGGTFTIRGQDTVVLGGGTPYLFDLGANTQSSNIVMTDNKYVPNVRLVKGSYSNRHPTFLVNTVSIHNWQDVGNWEGVIVGNVTTANPTFDNVNNQITVATYNWKANTGSVTWDSSQGFTFNANRYANINAGANNDITLITIGTNYGTIVDGRLFQRDAFARSYSALGTLQGRLPVCDADKNLFGYAPLYSSVT